MASRAQVLPHQRGTAGETKPTNAVGNGKNNRKVLGDIGNLVVGRVVQTGKDLQKPRNEEIRENGAVTKALASLKLNQPSKPEVLAINTDENEKSCKPVGKRTPKRGTKTFSATLTARSKAANGMKKCKKDTVIDIDAADTDNELAAVEYVDDIYMFYKMAEVEGKVRDYMGSQPELNTKMRSILIDWLVEVHRKFELMPETLYLTINLIDRFLSVKVVPRRELQLLGMSSMLIASKYEEIWAPEVNDLVLISDSAYVKEQVLAMEKSILGQLEWYITVPTPYVFLARYVKASVPCDKVMENLVFYLAELGLVQYPSVVLYLPSMLAASAVYAARSILDWKPFWTETLKHHTGYTEDEISDCAKMLVELQASASESKLRAVYKKFSVPGNCAVSLLVPAKDSSVSCS
ncbi:PREDICTED: cyclin-B1-4-like [Tarenaya hassleriana]|uniref:cyclin-B1-4-like n=1 Tax=Tarenaya hassleriana TaxID=28532 RepID=UPI00053C6227|nr:PREDICTED: cyclin-B1-4-like [Tarenaya hassleriana]